MPFLALCSLGILCRLRAIRTIQRREPTGTKPVNSFNERHLLKTKNRKEGKMLNKYSKRSKLKKRKKTKSNLTFFDEPGGNRPPTNSDLQNQIYALWFFMPDDSGS